MMNRMKLNLELNIADHDAFYERLIDTHNDFVDEFEKEWGLRQA